MTNSIGTLNEKPLHAALRDWYIRPGDEREGSVDGFFVDIVRGNLLVEIQTRGIGAIKRKLTALTATHTVRLVYPVAREKWIVRLGRNGDVVGRRRSPKRGAVVHIFDELASLPRLLTHPNFSLEVLSIREEEVRRQEVGRAWRRRGWVTNERRLVEVLDSRLFETPGDLCALIPETLAEPFSTREMARALDQPHRLAQKMAYCLREMGAIRPVGNRGRAILYVRAVGIGF
jgi:hypothetical protein